MLDNRLQEKLMDLLAQCEQRLEDEGVDLDFGHVEEHFSVLREQIQQLIEES